MGYEEDPVEESTEYITNENQEGYATSDSGAVMKNFFDTEGFLKRKEMEWKGFTIINNRYIKTNKPIACDSFINEMIGSMRSVINQHNSVSFKSKQEADRIIYEQFLAFNEAVLEEPTFDPKRYAMVKEEFDHAIELFMGLVINGHGKGVATSLQAGVAMENTPTPHQPTGVFSTVANKLKQR